MPDWVHRQTLARRRLLADKSEFRQAIDDALSSLPSDLREALVMRAIEGRSFGEMSVLLDSPEENLRARYREATAYLRDILGNHGWTQGEAQSDPDPGTAAFELAAEAVATESTEVVLKPEDFRLTPSLVVCDPRILQFLDQHPETLRDLTPRDFESLIAGILDRFGYSVELGPAGADGGVDVHATKSSATGLEYLVVQCKRFAATRKVSAPVVKQLWADVLHRGATRGLAVTTSWFTKDALKYVSLHKYQLEAADFDRVREWLMLLTKRAT